MAKSLRGNDVLINEARLGESFHLGEGGEQAHSKTDQVAIAFVTRTSDAPSPQNSSTEWGTDANGCFWMHGSPELACLHVDDSHISKTANLQNIFDGRTLWALCYRIQLPVRGNQTNNFRKAAMRVLKDKVMNRITKAFNAPQLLHFLTTRMEKHYQNRLINIAYNHLTGSNTSRFSGN
ncbi:hypothetical protein CAPTEDRAFT_189496 [Capitella teleta]|uniref:Uncharacterized protein n=1 Tax=Capitella teleta TaxID=283909 RepID=R7T9R0_CAPTE|nr:hypothetical protein CAPTEDRAFT_189496 [Capitella teleta]|eukprot:ELT87724.1 hypothetical protein CAPTEDRAFT_189496 [Capitella teleta]